jgi:hypothetical protein
MLGVDVHCEEKKMRFTLLTVLVLLFAVSVVQMQSETVCDVPDTYLEALGENEFTLTRVLVETQSPGSDMSEPETAATFYATLQSMRHYHEDMRAELPDCAQSLNTEYVDVVSASQDMLAYFIARGAVPEKETVYNNRLESAADYLREQWSDLLSEADAVAIE